MTHRRRPRTRRRSAVLVVAAIVAAAGCGGGPSGDATAEPSAPTGTGATTTAATGPTAPGSATTAAATGGGAAPATPGPTTQGPTTTVAPTTAPSSPPQSGAAPAWRPSPSDPLRVLVVGDSVVWDATPGIEAVFESTGVAVVEGRATPGVGLATAAIPDADWRGYWATEVAATDPDLVVLMTGGWDLYALRSLGLELSTYAGLVDEALGVLSSGGARVLVVGVAPQEVANSTADELAADARNRPLLNDVFARAAADHPDAGYLSLDTVLGDAAGRFARRLPAADGVPELVRKPDGLHLCPAGALRVARAMVGAASEWFPLAPVDPAIDEGAWRDDPRYDDPPGGCTEPPV